MCVSDSDTGLELQGRVRVREISGMEGEREKEGGSVRVRGDIGTYGFPLCMYSTVKISSTAISCLRL